MASTWSYLAQSLRTLLVGSESSSKLEGKESRSGEASLSSFLLLPKAIGCSLLGTTQQAGQTRLQDKHPLASLSDWIVSLLDVLQVKGDAQTSLNATTNTSSVIVISGVVEMPVLLVASATSVLVGSLTYWIYRSCRPRPKEKELFKDPREEYKKRVYQETNGFKDPSLYRFIDTCKDTKKSLKKVEDPAMARKQKLRDMKLEQLKPKGPLKLTPDKLQEVRSNLSNVTNKRMEGEGLK